MAHLSIPAHTAPSPSPLNTGAFPKLLQQEVDQSPSHKAVHVQTGNPKPVGNEEKLCLQRRHSQQEAECHLGACRGAEHDSTQGQRYSPRRVKTLLLQELVQRKQTNPSVLLCSLTITFVPVKAASEVYL